MTLRIYLAGGRYKSLLSVYINLTASEKTCKSFYQAFIKVVTSIPRNKSMVILEDFNTRDGSDSNTWKSIGSHGIVRKTQTACCCSSFVLRSACQNE